MSGLLKTNGLSEWKLFYMNENSNEEKIQILKELGYELSSVKKEKERLYILKKCDEEIFKTIDDVIYYIDKEGWFYNDNVAICDIAGEEISYDNSSLKAEEIPKKDEIIYRYDLSKMGDNEKIALIAEVDFAVVKQCNGVFSLKDYQGGNLAGIEYQRFDSIDIILERLENYWNDYNIELIS